MAEVHLSCIIVLELPRTAYTTYQKGPMMTHCYQVKGQTESHAVRWCCVHIHNKASIKKKLKGLKNKTKLLSLL